LQGRCKDAGRRLQGDELTIKNIILLTFNILTISFAIKREERELAKPMLKNQYGQYLMSVIEEKKADVDSDFFRYIQSE